MKFKPLRPYLTEVGKLNLTHHTYHGVDESIIAKYMQPFWEKTVKLLPLWMAPNLVTTLGFICVVVGYALEVLVYCPKMYDDPAHPAPAWIYLFSGVALFIYQTLDAIDGKQARRTNSSSPLGELFDHGVDALVTMFQAQTVVATSQLGCSHWLWTFVFLSSVHISAYIAILEGYYTGILRFGAWATPTEVILMAIASQLVTFAFGPSIWTIRIPFTSVQINEASVLVVFAMSVVDTFQRIEKMVGGIQAGPPPRFLPSSTRAAITARDQAADYSLSRFSLCITCLRDSFGLISCYVLTTLWAVTSPSNIADEHRVLFYSVFGLLSGYLVTRLVLFRVTNMTPSSFYEILVPLPFIALSSVSAWDKNHSECWPMSDVLMAQCYVVYIIVLYSHLVWSVITELCEYLKISAFTINTHKRVTIRPVQNTAARRTSISDDATTVTDAKGGACSAESSTLLARRLSLSTTTATPTKTHTESSLT